MKVEPATCRFDLQAVDGEGRTSRKPRGRASADAELDVEREVAGGQAAMGDCADAGRRLPSPLVRRAKLMEKRVATAAPALGLLQRRQGAGRINRDSRPGVDLGRAVQRAVPVMWPSWPTSMRSKIARFMMRPAQRPGRTKHATRLRLASGQPGSAAWERVPTPRRPARCGGQRQQDSSESPRSLSQRRCLSQAGVLRSGQSPGCRLPEVRRGATVAPRACRAQDLAVVTAIACPSRSGSVLANPSVASDR